MDRAARSPATEPLRAAGKLGAVRFQFAPWVISNPDGRAHVDHCADQMEGFTVAAEFRHRSWFSEAAAAGTLQIERSRHLVNVVVDEPQDSGNSVPRCMGGDDGLAIVRLHGRNHETWNVKDAKAASDRFNYDNMEQRAAVDRDMHFLIVE